jgi:IMP dehydrogenase
MTSVGLHTAPVGTTLDEAQELFRHIKVEKLPVVDHDGYLRGLITIKDLKKRTDFPNATKTRAGDSGWQPPLAPEQTRLSGPS